MSATDQFRTIIDKLAEAGLLEPGPLAMMSLRELLDAAELVRKEVIEEEGGTVAAEAEHMVEIGSVESETLGLLWDRLRPLHSGAVRIFKMQSQQRLQDLKMERVAAFAKAASPPIRLRHC